MEGTQPARKEPRLQGNLSEIEEVIGRIVRSTYRIWLARKRIAGEDTDPPSDEVDQSNPSGICPCIEFHISSLNDIAGTLEAESDILESLV